MLLAENGEISSELYRLWRNGKGVIDQDELKYASTIKTSMGEYVCHVCPCGAIHYVAMRPWVQEGLSQYLGDLVTCFPTNKQWLVRRPEVRQTIYDEEVRYLNLLERAPEIVRKVVGKRGWSDETAAFLADTHGIDKELAESLLGELT